MNHKINPVIITGGTIFLSANPSLKIISAKLASEYLVHFVDGYVDSPSYKIVDNDFFDEDLRNIFIYLCYIYSFLFFRQTKF